MRGTPLANFYSSSGTDAHQRFDVSGSISAPEAQTSCTCVGLGNMGSQSRRSTSFEVSSAFCRMAVEQDLPEEIYLKELRQVLNAAAFVATRNTKR